MTTMAAVQFTNTVTLGALIIGALVAISGLSMLFYGVRYKSLYQLEQNNAALLLEGREVYRLRADRLEHEVEEAREIRHQLKTDLAAERLKTDLTGLMKQMQKQHTELLKELTDARLASAADLTGQMQQHEERALDRHEQLVAVLHAIRDALVRQQ